LLAVAREYARRGLPLSVIVADYFHWTAMGDFDFDPAEWPDPAGMVAELDELGTKLMVSVWPTVSPLSRNYAEARAAGHLLGVDQGVEFHQEAVTKPVLDAAMPIAFYDATNPAARDWLWGLIKANHFDIGVRVFWLDACEPEVLPTHPGNLSYYAGPGDQVTNIYPRDHARGFAEHLRAEGCEEYVLLCRSAWAGQAKYGAAVWSGDVEPSWQALAASIPAGLSIGLSGIPWWTTDIGGFLGGDPDDPAYRELLIRWLEFGAFCPLFRMHGHREPREAIGTGGPNEIWSYGQEAEQIAAAHIRLRERLRPYLRQAMSDAAHSGLPPMRPLFLEFPADSRSWVVADQFMLGPDLMVAPVTGPGRTQREVYFPAGARWTDAATGIVYEGDTMTEVEAPLRRIPLFSRNDSRPFGE
jgi:alpha-D-xyloside xylohydrolase